MMMGVLRFPKLRLMADHRHAILTQRAIHVRLAVQRLLRPIEEDVQKQRMSLQMGRAQEVEIGPEAASSFHLGIERLSSTPVNRK